MMVILRFLGGSEGLVFKKLRTIQYKYNTFDSGIGNLLNLSRQC